MPVNGRFNRHPIVYAYFHIIAFGHKPGCGYFCRDPKLFIAETENKLKIVGEEYQTLSRGLKASPLKDPVRLAFETLHNRLKTEQKIAHGTKARSQRPHQ